MPFATAEHDKPRLGAGDGCLEILGETAVLVEPGEGALDDRSARQEHEAGSGTRALDDFERPFAQGRRAPWSLRQHGGHPEQVVAAAIAVTVARPRLRLGNAGFLAQAGQCVIFAEDGDHRPVFAGFTDHRGGDAGDVLRHPETLQFQ